MDEQPITTLDPGYEEPQQTTSLDTGSQTPIVSNNTAGYRSDAARFAQSFPDMHTTDVFRRIQGGYEHILRESASAQRQLQLTKAANQVIVDLAQAKGRPLTPMEVDFANNQFKLLTSTPQTILEKDYARAFTDYLKLGGKDPTQTGGAWYDRELPKPEELPSAGDLIFGRTRIAQQQIVLKYLMENRDAMENRGIGEGAWDFTKNLIPLYSDFSLRGLNNSSSVSGMFLGENLERQAEELYGVHDLQAFNEKVRATYEYLSGFSRMQADNWLSAMFGMSASEKVGRNIGNMLDILGIPGLVTTGRVVKKLSAGEAVWNSVKASADITKPAAVRAAEGVGNISEAGVQTVAAKIVKELDGKFDPSFEAVSVLHNTIRKAVEGLQVDVGNLGREATQRIIDRTLEVESAFTRVFTNGIRVERLPALEASSEAARVALEETRGLYPNLRNTVINSDIVVDPATGVRYGQYTLGKNGVELFSSEKNAKKFIEDMNLGFANVEPVGGKFRVSVLRPIPENSDFIRNGLIPTGNTEAVTPASTLNSFRDGLVGKIRTPEEVLSEYNKTARHTATYAPNAVVRVMFDSIKELNALRSWSSIPYSNKRAKWQEFHTAIERSLDPATIKAVTGRPKDYFFQNVGEVEQHWQNVLRRAPDEAEVSAYFAWARAEQMNDVFRNIHALRNKYRKGDMSWSIMVGDSERGTARANPVLRAKVDGAIQKGLPTGSDPVLIIGDDTASSSLRRPNDIRGKLKERLEKEIENGQSTHILLSNPEDYIVRDLMPDLVGNARVSRIIVRNAKPEPLNWQQVTRRPPMMDYNHALVQPIVKFDPVSKLWNYEYDKTMAVFQNQAEARAFTDKMNTVRELIRSKKMAEAEATWNANPVGGMEFADVKRLFRATAGRRQPFLTTEDFHVVPWGQLAGDTTNTLQLKYKDALRNRTREGYGRYLEENADPFDVFSVRDEGTKGNPSFSLQKVQYLDPITSLNRSMSRMAHSQYLDDYKITAIEHWIEEAKNYIKDVSPEDLRRAPFHYFYKGELNKSVQGENFTKVSNLEASRYHIQQLLGVKSPTDTWLYNMTQKMSDSLYTSAGPKAAMLPTEALSYTKDPFGFIRGVAFHAKIGVFALPQVWANAQSFVTIWGIAGPTFAAPGTKAAFLHMLSRLNPSMIDTLDQLASKKLIPGTAEFKPGQWKEAKQLFDNDFKDVAGEYAARDNHMKHDIVSTPTSTFLNAGTWFFRNTEKMIKAGSYYTSYLEWRQANPTATITNAVRQQLVDRADLLYTNMSRASSSMLHSGVMSLPTQFYSYPLRLAELFTGKRLTTTERARLFGTYAAIYGLPVAFNVSGFPMSDLVKRWAIEDGYVQNESTMNDLVTAGLPSVLLSIMMGGDQEGKPQSFNFSERYGPSGFEPIKEILRGDATIWSLLGGASGNVLANTLMSTAGFWRSMGSLMKDGGVSHPMKFTDLADMFNEISTVARFRQFMAAVGTGKWLSRNETYLSDVDMKTAVFLYLSGMSPQGIEDIQNMKWSKDDQDKLYKDVEKDFNKEMRRAWQAAADGNYTQADDFFTRAAALLEGYDYPIEKRRRLMSQSADNNRTIISRVKHDYYTRDVPESKKDIRREAYRSILQQGQ